jgi:dihydrolipoamide dehydrogenase
MPIYDLAIIGAGWAGFNAALRAKQLGQKACLIEGNQIGGTCLNRGCIPTKSLIQSAKVYSLAKKISAFGIELDNLRINFSKIQGRKDKIVKILGQGMQSRLTGIDFIKSYAKINSPNEIKVADGIIKSKFILIATGSEPAVIPGLAFDHLKIITSDDILSLTEIPQSLLIIGGGVIGCEFASLFSILGSIVTIAEKLPGLLPAEDTEVSRKTEVIFKKKGIKVVTDADISTFDLESYSKVLVCVGRLPHTQGLGSEDIGVQLKNNSIVVDDYLKSSLDNIYAAGDCTSKVMLAHYAAYQGVMVVDNMFSSHRQKADNLVVPVCIFTEPQIASVGLNEKNAIVGGLKIKVHKFDFRANAMAQIIDEVDGFVKIISNQENGQIIGASIIGPQATELICNLVVAISKRLTINQIRGMIFAHPTFSESLHETVKN